MVHLQPHWLQLVDVPDNTFALGVGLPCAGIDGPGRAMMEAAMPFRPRNVIDKEKHVIEPLNYLHGYETAMDVDITKMDGPDWESSEGLVAGFPPKMVVSRES